MRWTPQLAFATCTLALLATSLVGCCGPLLVSHRVPHASAGDCGAPGWESSECIDESCGPATPAIVVPALPALPAWLRCNHWKAKSRHLRQDFGELLQPGPEPPLKPPHARFHPVPTQPVFAARAGYVAPQLVGAHPPADLHVEHLPPRPLSEQFDEIPAPIPDTLPRQPVLPAPDPVLSPPAETEPFPKNNDALRGRIGRVQFLSPEPNPLR